jgi:hypothetical protein
MGLMDKVKAQATQIADKAQEAGRTGQAKLEAVQAKRRADALLEELGRIVYHAQTGRPSPADDARTSEIVDQLRQYEAEHGPVADGDAMAATDAASSPFPASPSPEPAAPATGPAPVATPDPEAPSAGGIPKASFGSSEL